MAFQPGQSGNPAGRPKGVQDRRSKLLDMVQNNQDQLVQTAINMALNGSEPMLKLLLDRILPPKPREESVDICLIANNFVDKSKTVIEYLSTGEITPSQAKDLMGIIFMEADIYETHDLSKRVDELFVLAGKKI